MSKSKVLILMTGSIACYKIAQVISRLTQRRCEVQVVASPSALQFLGNATIEGLSGRPLVTEMYGSGNVMDHIHLVRWADVILVAPATANFINKAAQGVGDDLLTTMFLAHDFKKPFLIAPAMNTAMYLHPVTQKSIRSLTEMGVEILETASGVLACGEEGQGRLLEPELILDAVMSSLRQSASQPAEPQELKSAPHSELPKTKILVTSGGTQEPIDTVRVITNLSSGETGRKIAEHLDSLGFEVFWLKSHQSKDSFWIKNKAVFTDYSSLKNLLEEKITSGHYTHVIHLAAVSDYSVQEITYDGKSLQPLEQRKLDSSADIMKLTLKKNPKLIRQFKQWDPKIKVIAFKLTSGATEEEKLKSVQKLQEESDVDIVVQNDLSEMNSSLGIHPFYLYRGQKATACQGVDQLVRELSPVLGGEL